ncbi:hypothetical protein SEA_ENNEA_68 [Gordonia phage Ennea]|nr:hypothetical protein SEA_ENNEA_68 [Gordonia phage Ennea]
MAELISFVLTGINCDNPLCESRVDFEVRVTGTHLSPPDHRGGGHHAVPKLIEEGWSLWAGQRNRRTYCPNHKPTVPMRRIW